MSEEVLMPLLPTRELMVEKANIRVIVFMSPDPQWQCAELDPVLLRQAIENWLDGLGPLFLIGVERVEVYEILRK